MGESTPKMAVARKRIKKVLSELGFASTDAALNEVTLLSAASQLAQYEEECARFERRYAMSLRHEPVGECPR